MCKYDLNNVGGDSYLIYAEGHHDLDDFAKVVKEEYDSWGNFFDAAYHHYYRRTGNQHGSWVEPCFPHVRGAFPVTIAQEGWEDFNIEWNFKKKMQLIERIGNFYILKNSVYTDRLDIWYEVEGCVPTNIHSFKLLAACTGFIEMLVKEKGWK